MSDSKHHSAASKKEEGTSRRSSDNHSRSSSRSRSRSRSKSSSRSGSAEYSSRSRSRSRSYSRSRSRSHSRGRGRHSRSRYRRYSRSYSRSRSYSPKPYRRRDYSRSPLSNRKRHQGLREEPEPDRCLGVFGLSLYTTEKDLKPIFEKYGPIENISIVYDHQTGRSRGFGFVYYEYLEDAEVAKERTTGIELDGRQIRVDFSITKRAHTPTPGVYMGKPSQHRDYRNWRDTYRDDHRDDDYYHERSGNRHRRYRSRSR